METSDPNSYNPKTFTEREVLEILSSTLEPTKFETFETLEIPEEIKYEKEDSQCLTSKNAVKFLLDGTLKKKVCRYCLNVSSSLSELDQILQVAGRGTLYKVTIRDMIASFHPFKVADDPNFPNKICEKCVDRTLSSYLFSQQCERSERALRNCFDDMYEKVQKLDPLEKQKKRGRQKSNPNYNMLFTEHEKVIDYAEPLITVVNTASELVSETQNINANKFICSKCCQSLPTIESLLNHEKSHPSSMWYHCHLCGKSFPKRIYLRRHMQSAHAKGKQITMQKTDFKCQECLFVSVDYHSHLQHIEKHKFKELLQNLLTRKMDKLCAVCLNKGMKLIDMEEMVCLHGGYPEMMGDRTLYNILGSTVPEMNMLHNYTSTKICDKCLNHAIIAYVFIQQAIYVRNRLNTCIISMLQNLNKIESPKDNLLVEISQQLILPIKEEQIDENLLFDDLDDIDESKLKVEVLEDEFRVESDSDQSEELIELQNVKKEFKSYVNKAKKNKNVEVGNNDKSKNNINGFCSSDTGYKTMNDVCSEFLTFKKKKRPVKHIYKFTCPLCNKHFISDYFLRRHVSMHVLRRQNCKVCRLEFTSKFYLYEHVKIRHLLQCTTNVTCRSCGRNFLNAYALWKHEKCHQMKKCQLCEKTFKTQQYYDGHMQRHVNQFKFLRRRSGQNCSFCEKECPSDNDLSVHVNKVHLQIKPYSCDMCDKQFYTENNMMNHKMVHSLPSREICEFCNKKLKTRAALVIHVRKHIGIRPHNCQICNKDFYSQSGLERHMKYNHGGRYCCKLCKKVFSSTNKLKFHVHKAHSII